MPPSLENGRFRHSSQEKPERSQTRLETVPLPAAEDEADYRQWCADVDSKLLDLEERARWENQCTL